LTSRLDSQLTAAAHGSLYQVFHDERGRAPTPQVLWMTQLDVGGAVLDVLPSSGEVRHMWLSADERARLASPAALPATVHTMDGQTLRVISEPQPQLQGTVVIGLSMDSVQAPLHHLLLLELLVALGAAAVATGAAVGIRYSLRPIKRLTATARLVSADLAFPSAGLSRRAPVTTRNPTARQANSPVPSTRCSMRSKLSSQPAQPANIGCDTSLPTHRTNYVRP
jgi:hypothetical protein